MASYSKKSRAFVLLSILLFPSLAFAAPRTYADLINFFVGIIKLLVPIIGGLALLAFFWGLGTFIFSAGDAKAHESGRSMMIYGLVALFAMMSIFGLISFVGNLIFGNGFSV